MSKELHIALLSGCFLLLTGCTPDALLLSSPESVQGEMPAEIAMRASLVQAEVSNTRTTDFIQSLTNQVAGVSAKAYPAASDYIHQVPFQIHANGQMKAAPEAGNLQEISAKGNLFFPPHTEQLDVYAVVPKLADVLPTDPYKVRSGLVPEADWASSLTDPVWSKVTLTANNPMASFAFAHVMAKLDIYVTTSANYLNYQLKDIRLTVDRGQCGYLDVQTGQITSAAPATPTSYTEAMSSAPLLEEQASTPLYGNAAPQFSNTLLPQTVIREIKMTLLDEQQQEHLITVLDATHNTQLSEAARTLQPGGVTKFIIRYKTGNSSATRRSSTEVAAEAVLIDYLP